MSTRAWLGLPDSRADVLSRLHILMIALRSRARRNEPCTSELVSLASAIDALMVSGMESFEAVTESLFTRRLRWERCRGWENVAPSPTVELLVRATALGCRAAANAPLEEVARFADTLEYVFAVTCAGDLRALAFLNDGSEPPAIQVIGRAMQPSP